MTTAPPAPPGPALFDAITSSPSTTSTAAGVLLPLLVGLCTTRAWPPAARGALLLAAAFTLAAAAELTERAQADAGVVLGPIDWGGILASTFTTWVAAQTAHQGLWRKSGLSAWLQALGTRPRPAAGHGTVATIRRAQGPTTPREPRRRTAAPASARDEVRPRPARPRDPAAAARAEQRARLARGDPPTGRHAWSGPDDDGPATLQER